MPAPRRLRQVVYGLLLLAPALAFLLPFTVWPALHVIHDSFYRLDLAHPAASFIGLDNYIEELTNPAFQLVLRNTAFYAVVTVPVSTALALVFAVQLNKRLRASAAYRLALFYPTILPTVGAAAIWLFIYVPTIGLADRAFSLVGIPSHNWLGDPGLVLPALMVLAIWKQTGYFAIFYLAGLQALPKDVFEAAEIDGATGWSAFVSMTVPLLSGTTVFVTTVALVDAFQTVDQLFVLTQGGPDNASNLLLYWLYQEGFRNFNFGRASAVTVIMMAIVFSISFVNYRYLDRGAQYEA